MKQPTSLTYWRLKKFSVAVAETLGDEQLYRKGAEDPHIFYPKGRPLGVTLWDEGGKAQKRLDGSPQTFNQNNMQHQ